MSTRINPAGAFIGPYLVNPVLSGVKKIFSFKSSKKDPYADIPPEEKKALEQIKYVGITRQGFVFDTAERIKAMSPHIIISDRLIPYLDIHESLNSLIKKGVTFQGKAYDLEKDSIVCAFYNAFNPIRKNKEIFNPFDECLNTILAPEGSIDSKGNSIPTGYLPEIFSSIGRLKDVTLSQPERENLYNHINTLFEHVKITLTNAATELGILKSVFGIDETKNLEAKNVKDCIEEFNDVFQQAYELYQKFEIIKATNASGDELRRILYERASLKVNQFVEHWKHPIKGRIISLGISYGLTHGLPLVYYHFFPKVTENDDETKKAAMFWGVIGTQLWNIASSQFAVRLYIDEAIRNYFWYTQKKIPDIFNFCNGARLNFANSAGVGGITSSYNSAAEIRRKMAEETSMASLISINGTKAANLEKLKKEKSELMKLYQDLDNYFNDEKEKIESIEEMIRSINVTFYYHINHKKDDDDDNELDKKGEIIKEPLNDGKFYKESDLNKSTLSDLLTWVEQLQDEKEIEISKLEDAKTETDVKLEIMAREGIAPMKRRVRSTRNQKAILIRANFEDYKKDDAGKAAKRKLLENLTDKDKIDEKKGQFVNLDPETTRFLYQLCEEYSDRSEAGFRGALDREFNDSLGMRPGTALATAIEFYAKAHRKE